MWAETQGKESVKRRQTKRKKNIVTKKHKIMTNDEIFKELIKIFWLEIKKWMKN